ncbi:MAG TPA: adenylate/guanylate cyclase domain-containing protein [Candidatus Limnocylindrales bacterium]|nr:adenylate/guanylate cyclase domain-containing protein [Candidatus Limnocylindrales bacterium]
MGLRRGPPRAAPLGAGDPARRRRPAPPGQRRGPTLSTSAAPGSPQPGAIREPSAEGPTGIRTFLFSDIEGSTRLEQEVGTARYSEVRERHRALLRGAFEAHGGVEQGTEGDSFFVVFPGARSAVLAAIDAQRALVAEPWPDGLTLKVRMGLHAGEAAMAGGSLVGLDINRAARIAAVANGGQVVISDAIRSLVANQLPTGVMLKPLGSHRLKDLREPEALLQVVADGLPETFPPLRSIDARPNNLPTQLTSFVGREAELAEAGRLLAQNRLVTLTGPGGTGKTRLSLQVAANAAADYPDGIFFVALETVREPALVAPRITAAIGLTESNRPAIDLLRDWLAGRTALLVLDNLEQVLGVGPILTDLLRSAPQVSILATSRAALRVSGEQEYPVPGLPAPPDPTALSAIERARLGAAAIVLDPATLSTYEAVRLFIARAAAVRPGFEVTNDNAPAVAAITTRLYGMPLPIELAAARVKLLSPDAILGRLEHQLRLLASGSRDLPERQQTLRGAIAWSYDLLDDSGRKLLDRLSVFRGTFELAAADEVCGPASEFGRDPLDGLTALADQSLLRSLDVDGEPRFEMLETIREFAAEMLAARGEQAEIERRHAAWYLGLAERAVPELARANQREWLERLEAAHDNIRAVLDRATEAGDAPIAIGLAFAAWRFWQKRGHLYEARRRLDAMAEADWSHRDPLLRARLMEALGGVAWWQGDIRSMRPAYEEAVAIWRGIGDRAELANALYNYSFAFTVPEELSPSLSGDHDPDGIGQRALDEALALYRELGDERGEANVLWGIGNKHYFGNDPGAGAEMFSAALQRFRRVGDRTMEAWSLHMLGGAQIRTGQLDSAADNLADALRHFHDAGDAAGLTLVFDDLSSLALARDDPERAARLWGAARNLTNATGAGLAGFVDGWIEQEVRPNVRKALAPDRLAALAREGAALSIDAAVAYALGVPVEGVGRPPAEPST